MTAYGRAVVDTPQGRWTVEISSVNRKTADFQISMPRQLLKWEYSLRKWLSPHVQRGQINVRANLQKGQEPVSMADLPRLKKAKKTWSKLAADLGYDPNDAIDLRFLLDQTVEATPEQEAAMEEGLKKTALLAMEDWQAMREKEGKALKKDLEEHLVVIEKHLEKIAKLLPKATKDYKERLEAKLEEVSRDLIGNEERIMREVVILAEKLDVSEEMARLKSHLEQFRALLKPSKQPVGRTMDFLTQELHREINTLGAKASDIDIIRMVLEMKGEVEKIREQVQNIE